MKKKAIISTVASVVLAGVMCVGFAACADKAESMKGEEVTAEQWAEAFKAENFENVKIEMSSSMTQKMGDVSAKSESEGEIVIADGKAYYKMTGEANDDGETEKIDIEQYEEKSEGATVIYTKNDDGAWIKDSYGYSMAFSSITSYTSLATQYEKFEYNADKKGYVLKSDANVGLGDLGLGGSFDEDEVIFGGLSGMVYKFKDGKLAAVWADIDKEMEIPEMGTMSAKGTSSVLFTYGGQSVTLPTVE